MYKVFEKLLKTNGVTAYYVSKETGIPYSTFSSWKYGQYHPKDEKLERVAELFNVTVEYLKGLEKDIQCPVCHMRYDPVDMKSNTVHTEYHKRFVDVQHKYGEPIPPFEECEQKRVESLLILRDIGYDKHRRISAFNSYAKYDFFVYLYENDFVSEKNIDQHSVELADKFRPDRGISLDLCNAVRAEWGVDEYKQDMSINITEHEFQLVCKYREMPKEITEWVDKLFGI